MRSITTRFALFTAIFLTANSFAGELLPTADGFRGIWYYMIGNDRLAILNPFIHAAGFQADGDPRNVLESRLYFTNKTGDHVWELPEHMTGNMAKPQIVEFKQEQK